MYKTYDNELVTERRESFPIHWILAENALYISLWVTAGWLLLPFQMHGWPVPTIIWAITVIVVQIILKKHNCSGCYYYGKNCHLGWGRLSACLFRQDSGELRTGMRISIFYPASPPIILSAAIIAGVFCNVSSLHWILSGLYIVLNMISFPVRKMGCGRCAMRDVCFGSAVKKSNQDK